MEYVVRGRREGKTMYLIEKFLEDPERSIIVCPSEIEAKRLRSELQELRAPEFQMEWKKLLRHNIISMSNGEYLKGLNKKVYVDNLDQWIRAVFGNVQAVTMTEE